MHTITNNTVFYTEGYIYPDSADNFQQGAGQKTLHVIICSKKEHFRYQIDIQIEPRSF